MQCVTPMFRRYEFGNHKNGKIVPRSEVMEGLEQNPNNIRFCLDKMNYETYKRGYGDLYEQIPCNHCWACKLNYAAQWATRIMVECLKSEHNYFITFTYDDIHLPIPETTEYNGETYTNDGTWSGSLYPQDINRFMNTLRRRLQRKGHIGIKYFYAGEYGSLGRPHYHMILMNCPLDINEFYDFHQDPTTKKLHWKSHELEEIWTEGIIDIGEVEFASAAYVARYCMKKIDDNPDKTNYYSIGKEPEFIRMSRNPGIGMDYFNEHYEAIYKNDELLVKNFHGDTITVKPPKAWDKKFKEAHPDQWFKIQQSRKRGAERGRKLIEQATDATDLQKLISAAEQIMIKGKQLPRDL